MRKLASFLWWSYPRGTIEYDVMVGLILAFIFLTPPSFFRDQPRPGSPAGTFSFNWSPLPAALAATLPVDAPLPALVAPVGRLGSWLRLPAADARSARGIPKLLPQAKAAPVPPTDLAGVVAALDAAAPHIKSITASISKTRYDHVLQKSDPDGSGLFFFEKDNGKPRLAVQIQSPAPQLVLYRDGWAYVANPQIKQVDEYKATDYSAQVSAVLAIGFGGSGQELMRDFQAKFDGSDTTGGAATVKLALTPNDPKIAHTFPRIELWLDTTLWVARQQQFWSSGQDYETDSYSDLKINPSIPGSVYDTKFSGYHITPHNSVP